MSRCLLLRHAAHSKVNTTLVGRDTGIGLSEAGRVEAQHVANRLCRTGIVRIQSSPQRRAMETAVPIASRLQMPIEVCEDLNELDFGAWTGQSFEVLSGEQDWQLWNLERDVARTPGGESMQEAGERISAHIRTSMRNRARGRILMVTHAELIRAVVLQATGQPFSAWSKVDIPVASLTELHVDGGTIKLSGCAGRRLA